MGFLPAVRADVRERRARHRRGALRAGDRGAQGTARCRARHGAGRGRPAGPDRQLQADLRGPDRRGVPTGPARAATPDGPSGLRFLERRSRGGVPAPEPHPGRLGHGGQRAADGLRQQGGFVGVRRRVHPRRDDRRAPAVRRLPPERAGRGRRVRRAEHARSGRAGRADARGTRPADGDHARAGASLQGHAGRRVHDRGRDALHAPDTEREAAGAGGGARGGRPGRGGPADEGGGADARRCREARRAAPSDVRPELPVPAAGARGPGIAGGGQGRDRLHGRGGGRPGRRRATP